ncbi:MAG: hypothetical protein AAFP04_04055 [Myxococcota bacterium]
MSNSGKVGGPGAPPVISGESSTEAPARATPGPAAKAPPSDSFSLNSAPGGGRSQATHSESAFSRDVGGAANLLQLARTNPQAAKQLVQSLTAQAAAALGEIEAARVGAQGVLERLARERFQKNALKKAREELRRAREKLSTLKLRHQMASRKMALLKQIAGKLGDPRLDDEIGKLLSQYKKLKTDWGRRYNALAMGQSLFGDFPETPEHLREVVNANVYRSSRARDISEALEQLSPRRVLSQLIARSIDGSTRVIPREKASAAARGDYGKSVQNYAFLSEALEDTLGQDPLKKK